VLLNDAENANRLRHLGGLTATGVSSCAKTRSRPVPRRSARPWEKVAPRKTRPKLPVKSRQRSDRRTREQFGNT